MSIGSGANVTMADKSVCNLTYLTPGIILNEPTSFTRQYNTISLSLDVNEDEIIPDAPASADAPSATRLLLANTLQVIITP